MKKELPSEEHLGPTKAQLRLINCAAIVREQWRPSWEDQAFGARELVMATLPHRNPGDIPEWCRRNGAFTLSIRPGYATDPKTGQRACVGYPYGSLPRLLLYWMVSEAVQKRTRRIVLGRSLNGFLTDLGLSPETGGGKRSDAKRMADQMRRLFRASISFEYAAHAPEPRAELSGEAWVNMPITKAGETWFDSRDALVQDTLWESWVELGESFYEAVIRHPIPIDMRVLRALKQSPLALDLYAWMAYRLYTVTKSGQPANIPWKGLMEQFGANFADPKDFKRKAKAALVKIRAIYPQASFHVVPGGLRLEPGTLLSAPKD